MPQNQQTNRQYDGSIFIEENAQANQPGTLRVIKRNGAITGYNDDKISVAMTKAFLATDGDQAAQSSRVHQIVAELTEQISSIFNRRMPSGGTIHIEDIQDQVELALMRSGEHRVARNYVIYRNEHAKLRELNEQSGKIKHIQVKNLQGKLEPIDLGAIQKLLTEACFQLEDVEADKVFDALVNNIYDGMDQSDLDLALIMCARALIEKEPNYTYLTARLLLNSLRTEVCVRLNINQTEKLHQQIYAEAFKRLIVEGIEHKLLTPGLQEFDLDRLAEAIVLENDLHFTYLGLQTLYDRYFLHIENKRIELPQTFFMRVAMGLALQEDQRTERAIEFYHALSSFDYMSSTPTLFNSATLRPQLSSCYLTTVEDDLKSIYQSITDNAMLSKWAGGLGNDWTPIRSLGARIQGTNGLSQGVVPFLKVVNDTAVAVNQGGKRKGAVCAYLETWHLDIEEFLELRKNTGDDRRRTHDMNTANWVPDLFMKRVFDDELWTLFSPSDVPDLHDLYGKAFAERYSYYEQQIKDGAIKLYKQLPAKDLWRKMLSMLFETGHPWITFKDVCNLRSPQQHCGVVHSSNLCTEITLNTSKDEIAVCNLGSINLPQHIDQNGKLDQAKLKSTVTTAIRMLDNVIDTNYYAVSQAEASNLKHRPIGLGMMGFQDALYKKGIAYGSEQAVDFADQITEQISYHAIEASSDLALERGSYKTYPDSLWSQGILPIDSINILAEARGTDYLNMDNTQRLDWKKLRSKIQKQAMRNSNVLAIAPTATIANITGVTQSIEPTYQNLYVKSNLSGEFTVINPYLVKDLKLLGLWDEVMINDIKYFDGSIQAIQRIPEELKQRYATAFEIEARWLVEAASRRQKWLDQAQSLNLYIANANGKVLDLTYRMAWYLGLKTTYYLRSQGASSAEKSTLKGSHLNLVDSGVDDFANKTTPQACAIDDPDCEACQ